MKNGKRKIKQMVINLKTVHEFEFEKMTMKYIKNHGL